MAGIGSTIIIQSRKIRRRLSGDKKIRRKILYGQALFIYFFGSVIFLLLPAILFKYMEDWKYFDAFYCNFMKTLLISFAISCFVFSQQIPLSL